MNRSLALLAMFAVVAAPVANAVEYRTVLPAQSTVGFEFRQMGVPVKGSFRRFTPQLRFDPARPEAASAQIEIDIASIDAGSPEANEESAGRLWFDRNAYPHAQFVSSRVRPLGNSRYEMHGTITIKGRRRDVVVPVTFVPGKDAASFQGAFTLKRLDFGVGEGMWADVATVANEVQVRFKIAASGK
jgi:polyisoprenoid-binding protein YceI